MSEIRDLLTTAISERQPSFGDAVTLERTGAQFSAELQQVQDIEANTLLGRDARESVIFHILDRTIAATIALNDVLDAIGQQFRVLRRSDNPASPQVDFGTMKLTGNDEA